MQDLQKTKKKINFLFVIIIFILFLSIGIGFFVFKFFYGEKNQLDNLQKIKFETKNHQSFLLKNLQDYKKNLEKKEENNFIIPEKIETEAEKFLKNFEKEIFDLLKKQDEKISIYPQVNQKIKKAYKIFSQKYIVFDANEKKIIFSNLENLQKINFKKIAGIKDEIKKLDDYFVFKVDLKDEKNILNYQILFLEKQKFLFSQLKKDLILYLFFAIFSLFILYFITKKIINYIFKPVEKNISEMEEFTHHAGHELKNPLAGVKSSIELLKEFGEYKEKLVNQSLGEIKKIDSLIDTLKDFSFLENDQELEKIDVSLEIKKIIKKYYKQIKEKKIKIIFEQKNNFIIKAPKNHFYILFSNLFSNAIKYSAENPEIKIIIDKKFFIIKDNGVGIKKENQEKIFQKFYREKTHRDSKGFGLGLSLVEKIIKINSWKIDFKSEKNNGTIVKVEF